MAAPHFSLPDAKAAARARALEVRAGCDPALGAALLPQMLEPLAPKSVIAGFWPLPGEIDLRPLLHGLAGGGHTIVLPVTPPRGQPLTFRRWTPGAPMVAGRFGTLHPNGPDLTPDVLLVPLLAYDSSGHRLGYGAGYYDRTLAGLPRAQAIGVAFSAQRVDAVPTDHTDIALDAVLTERGMTFFAH